MRFTLGWILFFVTACSAAEVTTQQAYDSATQGLDALWNTAVVFEDKDGKPLVGIASLKTVDGKQPYWGNEAGKPVPQPEWCFQAREGIPGAIHTFLTGYAAFGRPVDLERAKALGDTLLWVQERNNGGWFQDGIVEAGVYFNVQAWGDKHHAVESIQGLATLDDSASTSCAIALLALHEQTGESRFLAGARRFGDELHSLALRDEYRRGGLPQAFPYSIAVLSTLNQNLDPRNPDAPYLTKKTLNDYVMRDGVCLLQRLYEVTGDTKYRNAVTLNLAWLCNVRPDNGGWAQQYGFDDKPCWGRHKEPPTYAPCENGVVELFLWILPRLDASLASMVEAELGQYVKWLDSLPQCGTNRIHRYYDKSNAPVWAADYELVPEAKKASGQPWCGGFDYGWSIKSKVAGWQDRFRPDLPGAVIGLAPIPPPHLPTYLAAQRNGAYLKGTKLDGADRHFLSTSLQCNVILGMIRHWQASGGKPPVVEPPVIEQPEPPATQSTNDDDLIAAMLAEGGVVTLEPRVYKLSKPWNLRNGSKVSKVVGAGKATVLEFDTPDAAIDLTGNAFVVFQDFTIGGKAACGLLLSRSKQNGNSAQFHAFRDIYVKGEFSVACVVNYGSEVVQFNHCLLSNYAAGGKAYLTSWFSDEKPATPFGDFGGGSNVCHYFNDCHFGVYGGTGTETAIWFGPGTGFVSIRGGSMSCKPGKGGKGAWSAITLQGDERMGVYMVEIRDLEGETMNARYGLELLGGVSGVRMDTSQLYAQRNAVFIGGNVQGLRITNSRIWGGQDKSGQWNCVKLQSGSLKKSTIDLTNNGNSILPNNIPAFSAEPGTRYQEAVDLGESANTSVQALEANAVGNKIPDSCFPSTVGQRYVFTSDGTEYEGDYADVDDDDPNDRWLVRELM